MPSVTILEGDALTILRGMPDESVQCCVTSPPYWGLRDYGIPSSIWGGDPACRHQFTQSGLSALEHRRLSPKERRNRGLSAASRGFCVHCSAWKGCLGLEPTPELYITHQMMVFEEVRRVLKPDGTAWVNMGDSYAAGSKDRTDAQAVKKSGLGDGMATQLNCLKQYSKVVAGLKPKDLCGMPWRLAFGLQEAGWYLRCDIIWHKPNPMPESVTDRPTKAHEYIFLLSKNARYYYDIDAIREPASWNTHERQARALLGHKSFPDYTKNGIRPKKIKMPDGWDTGPGAHDSFHRNGREKGKTSWKGSEFNKGKTAEHHLGRSQSAESRKLAEAGSGVKNNTSFDDAMAEMPDTRNKRDVWSVNSAPFPEAHFATFPPDLIKPCILAGCMGGGIVLDPFGGSGTTGLVALELGRNAILIELNPEYAVMARRRCNVTPGFAFQEDK